MPLFSQRKRKKRHGASATMCVDPPADCCVDIVSLLPLELVLKILFLLDPKDVLNGLRVCRRWHDIIGGLDTYWKKACSHLGVPQCLIDHRVSPFASTARPPGAPRDQLYPPLSSLVAATLRHQHCLSSASTEGDCLTGGEIVSLQEVRLQRIVSWTTLYHYFRLVVNGSWFPGHDFIVIPTLQLFPTVKILNTDTKSVVPSAISANGKFELAQLGYSNSAISKQKGMVLWVKATSDYLLLFTSQGEWIGYDTVSGAVVLQWVAPGIQPRSKTRLHSLSHVNITCCEQCFLVAMARALSGDSIIWELQVFKIGKGESKGVLPEIAISRTMVFKLQQDEGVLMWELLPCTLSKDDRGFCKQHRLVCQSETKIFQYTITHDAPEYKRVLKAQEVLVPECRCFMLSQDHSFPKVVNSCFSQDRSLFGTVHHPSHLLIWNTTTWRPVLSAEINCLAGPVVQLVAVGCLYSVVASCRSSSNDAWKEFGLHVIATSSGQVIKTCTIQKVKGSAELLEVYLTQQLCLNDPYCFDELFFVFLFSNSSCLRYFRMFPVSKKTSLF